MYNFAVSEKHSYFVSKVQTLVHNGCVPNLKWLKKVDDPALIPNGSEAVADRAVRELGDGKNIFKSRQIDVQASGR